MPRRFASLPMYDLPELRRATDALWRDIASRLDVEGVPAGLDRTHRDDLLTHHWCHPALLLTQACGWPAAALLDGDVAIVGAFMYRGISDRHARYACHLVVRADDTERPLQGRAAAVNGTGSLSGWICLVAAVGEVGPVVITGSHIASLAEVRAGRADLASIDPVTWAHLARHRPAALDGLAIIGEGPKVPALPLITRPTLGPGVDVLRDVLSTVRSEALLIDGFVALDAADYDPVLRLGHIACGLAS
ncbi:MAG: phosphate/phosphite/phosphonate ABC transporter substrate-binding protein [Acidimicrobiales bacterium]